MSKKTTSGSKTNKKTNITEIWKKIPIKEFNSEYQISNCANVKNIKTGKMLKPDIRSGYLSYRFKIADSFKSYKVHRLVAKAFILNGLVRQIMLSTLSIMV
jgi:hypothetical protein